MSSQTSGIAITQAEVDARRWAIHVHQHVVPIGDVIEHEMCEDCSCHPRLEQGKSGGIIFVHHAFDQREKDEEKTTSTQVKS